jgi:zinc protease
MKKILLICSIMVAFVTFYTGVVQAAEDTKLVKPIQTFNLPNGQKVIIKEVHTNPIVTIDTWIRTGSVNEDESNNGVSHFLEHLLFKGTDKHPTGEIDEILESKGAIFNAGTSKDYTHFYVTIASEFVDLATNLHADMLLNANIPSEELEKERNVVLEEIRRAEDSPQRQVYYGLNDLLYQQHPYKYDTLGTEEIIKSISREKIFDYYHKWYVPQNMTTVVVGDVDTEKILKLIKDNFGVKQAVRMELPSYNQEPPLTEVVKKIQKDDYKQAYMEIGFRAPSIQNVEETYALDVASMVLGQGASSRLYKRLKQDQNLVNSLYASNFTMRDDGIFVFDFDLQPENVEKVKEIVLEEINSIKKDSITHNELERSKNIVARDFIYSNESVSNIATSIGYNVTIGELDNYLNYVENIEAITRDDVKEAVNKYLDTNAMAISILMPEDYQAETKTDKKNDIITNQPPQKSDDTSGQSKEVNKYVLPNGLSLLMKSNEANDVVSMDVYVKGGKLLQKTPGLTNVLTNLLTKGTESRTAEDIAREMEDLGIDLSADLGDDYISIGFRSTKNDFTEAYMVLADILRNSIFDPEELSKAEVSIKNSIQATEDSPLSYSFEKMYLNAYTGHPYGDVGPKVIGALDDITRDRLLSYYEEYFVPQNMVISVVGNIDPQVVKRYVEQTWSLEKTNEAIKETVKVQPLKHNKIIKVPKDTEAAWISLAWLAPNIKDEDYPAIKLMDALLGSGLSSRLARNLREEKGMAYNVGTFYPSRQDKSLFVMYIGTKPTNLNDVIAGFQEEINRLKTETISVEELQNIKQKLIGQFALAHETNSKQAFYLGWYEAVSMGYEYDKKYPEAIEKVTAEQIQEAANRIFSKPFVLSIVAPQEALDKYEE